MVWGSPNRFRDHRIKMVGDPQTNSGIPKPKRGSPNTHTKTGIPKATDSGIPEPKWGSPNHHTKTGIPEPKWGCESQTIPKPIRGSPNQNGDAPPNQFGDPRIEMGIKISPYQNGDPRIGLGMRITDNPQTNSGIPEPKWG